MKKTAIGLCALALCFLTACLDFCGVTRLEGKKVYEWSYTYSDGAPTSGTFETDQYGQATFDVPSDVDCGKVSIKLKEDQKDEMLDGPVV